jgi:hypothetical protein
MVSIVLILLGAWMFVSPKSAIDVKVWTAKQAGATLKATKKTETFFKYLGAAFVLVGLYMMFGA